MTWLDVLLHDSFSFAKYAVERMGSISDCPDELPVFRELGLIEHTDCPCCDKIPSDEKGRCDCLACEFQFLTNPEVFEVTFNGSEEDKNG